MSEYDHEPIPGLPGIPPPGETILWQGSPDWKALARTAFHTRIIAGYFALLAGYALLSAIIQGVHSASDLTGTAMTIIVGSIGVGLLHLLAWGTARSTVYTLTNRRIVLRIGIALPKCINLPLPMIGSVDLAQRADGTGDLPLVITGQQRLGYVALWPHARPWKISTPQPMLRSVPDASSIASLIARTCLAANPDGRNAAPIAPTAPTPVYAEAVTA